MQTVFSPRLLARLRSLNAAEEEDRDETFQDSDDRVDPDDSGPRLSVTFNEQPAAEIYALPVAQTG